MNTQCETLSDLRSMMIVMRKSGYKGVLRFTITRTYAREIWRELLRNGVEMPLPNIGNTMEVEFYETGVAVLEVM